MKGVEQSSSPHVAMASTAMGGRAAFANRARSEMLVAIMLPTSVTAICSTPDTAALWKRRNASYG